SATAGLTATGAVVGTADYIAPEQAMNSRLADIRSDIYSLGCTFYFLLTGRPPFGGTTATEKLARHFSDEPEPVERLRPEVPAALAAVVRKMMAKKPAERYQTPAEVVAALDPFVSGKRSTAVQTAAVAAALPVGTPALEETFAAEPITPLHGPRP